MKNIKLNITNFLIVFILSASMIFAANSTSANDKSVVLVAENLSLKLKIELVSDNVSVKLTNVQKSVLSSNEILIKGEATAVLPIENTELPLKFEAIVNPSKQIINNVEYEFVESSYAPTTDEEILMKHLLKKIAADYKTDNVVIAIDGFETENAAGN
ncbi:MAG: hypothetical protein ABIP06_11155, partial [Pyrinomonadaceae bacterium]